MARFDWDPKRPVFMDLETQSALSIRSAGARAYLRHASTRILSACFLAEGVLVVWVPDGRGPDGVRMDDEVEGHPTALLRGERPPVAVRELIAQGATFVAHNAENFDADAWELLVPGPQPAWYDTIQTCRAMAVPAGLDAACRAFGFPGKDEAGRAACELLWKAKVSRAGDFVYPVGTVPLWRDALRYNAVDVLRLRDVYYATRDAGERDVLDVSSRVNARGVPVDLRFAALARDMWRAYAAEADAAVVAETEGGLGLGDMRSPQKVKAWLRGQGIDIRSLERKQLESMLADPDGFFGDHDDPRVARATRVILARQDAVRATVGKVDRVFSIVDPDMRMRNMHVAYGAHTGRYSARDFQPHNLPRGVKDLDVARLLSLYVSGELDLGAVRSEAARARCTVGDALATLMRPIIRARDGDTLVPADYGAVEARCVAWLARDDAALAAFADPKRCIYCDTASRLYGRPVTKRDADLRFVGKKIVLGCGYQMGANKFQVVCDVERIDLRGVTAEECVRAYREGFPGIPALWRAYGRAAMRAVTHGETRVAGRCRFERVGSDLHIALPSSRRLRYRDARIGMRVPVWGGPERETLLWTDPHGLERTLYGGLICENVSQGTCRDLLVDAMIRIDPVYPVIMHVHDELVSEVREDAAAEAVRAVAVRMSEPPPWADGFPVRVESYAGRHYTKSPLSGAPTADAICGRLL